MPGLEETLGLLVDLAVAIHRRCATSTEALLDMLNTGDPTYSSDWRQGGASSRNAISSSVHPVLSLCSFSVTHANICPSPATGVVCISPLGVLNPEVAFQAIKGRHLR